MRVLFLTRKNLTQHPGGDTTQILQTAAAARDAGVTVDVHDEPPADLAAYDVVHLFHLDRLWENLAHARMCHAAGVPAVLSTIYWPTNDFDVGGRAGWQGWLARRAGPERYASLRLFQRHVLFCAENRRLPSAGLKAFSFRARVRELLELAAVILPNSAAEAEQIRTRFASQRPVVVVPNAADAGIFRGPSANAKRSGVLCVGRIEPRKNQLALIDALRDADIELTLVGQPGRYSRGYYDRCRKSAGPYTHFIPQQSPAELCARYQRAAVHACVSWYETPGLASLEAALCGCGLAVSPGGSTQEYFRDYAAYARHDDRDSLREAVQTALQRPQSAALADRVRREFNWARTAKRTIAAYELVLGRAPATPSTELERLVPSDPSDATNST